MGANGILPILGGLVNATELQGVAINPVTPTMGQGLVYTGFSWEPQTPSWEGQNVKLMNGNNYTLTISDIGNIVVANSGSNYMLDVDDGLAFTAPGQKVTLLIAPGVTGITINRVCRGLGLMGLELTPFYQEEQQVGYKLLLHLS